MDELEQCEERLRAAMLGNDVAELDALLADDLAFVGPTGGIATKTDDLAAHRERRLRLEELALSERSCRIVEPIAVVHVRARLVGSFDGAPIEGSYRYLRLWRRSGSGWQIFAGSVCAIPD